MEDFGRAYKWRPEKVVVECDECGRRMIFERSNLITSTVACECGTRSTADIREELIVEKLAEDELVRPWRYWQSKENAGIPV